MRWSEPRSFAEGATAEFCAKSKEGAAPSQAKACVAEEEGDEVQGLYRADGLGLAGEKRGAGSPSASMLRSID